MRYFLKNELFELNIFNSVKNSYKLHSHENLCICAIEKGEMSFLHGKEELFLKSGEIIIFNKNQPHRLKSYTKVSNYHILHIFKDSYIKDKIVNDKESFLHLISLKGEAKIINFIDAFLEKYAVKSIEIPEDEKIKQIKKHLDKNFLEEFSLEKIAKKFELNPSYLSRKFKEQYGLSPLRYITNKRVHLSKEMLKNGEDISQISLKLGFCDQAHFYKAFKSIFQITPEKYKKYKKGSGDSNSTITIT